MWLLPAAPLFTRDPLGTFDLADFFLRWMHFLTHPQKDLSPPGMGSFAC